MKWQGPLLADHLDHGSNSFNLVRLIAALLVVYSHSFKVLTGDDTAAPLFGWTPGDLGLHAVNVFFFLSGLMLMASINRRFEPAGFLKARALRIFPGLVVASIVVALVIAPLATALPIHAYYGQAGTYLYPLKVLVHFAHAQPPGDVFGSAPLAGQINEPLWTIRYELLAYLALGFLAWVGMLNGRYGLLAIGLGVAGVYALRWAAPETLVGYAFISSVGRFGVCFFTGILAFFFARRIRLSPVGLLVSAVLVFTLLRTGPVAEIAYILLFAYAALVIGAMEIPVLSAVTRRDDISYGVYLYGWPLQQLILFACPGIGLPLHVAASFAAAICAGALSWRFVEKPAMRLRALPRRAVL
jgi:peptidoglycan/LPS O-acetylase OafA/YrhL